MKEREYELGKGEIPKWLRKWLSQYKKPDGSIGYEYYTYSKYYNLNIGDKIIQKENGKIKIKRKKEKA